MESTSVDAVHAAIFERATGARLEGVERFVRSLPRMFPDVLARCDLAWRASASAFVVVMTFHGPELPDDARARLEFWAGRTGVRLTRIDQLPEEQREVFLANLEKCDHKLLGLEPYAILAQSARLFTELGANPDRRLSDGDPVLFLDSAGQGFAGVRYDAAACTLFIPGQLAPAKGDLLELVVRFAGADGPMACDARVAEVRSAQDVRPGAGMVGFTLDLLEPSTALLGALAASSAARETRKGAELRVHQRYAVKAPVVISPYTPRLPGQEAAAGLPALEEPPDPFPTTKVAPAEGDDLEDYIENLSQGGAFVRTPRPSPVGTRLVLQIHLPTGDELSGPAVVVVVKNNGMGVKFELPPEGQQQLAAALAQVAARQRRALVVDDEELVCRMLTDALQQRGFEVLVASDGAKGLSIVTDELLGLDLLITDIRMPNMDGNAFIRTIRSAGGESDLAIVAITSGLDGAVEKRLEREGADAVLDKELGPEIIAQAAEAVLERKRGQRTRKPG